MNENNKTISLERTKSQSFIGGSIPPLNEDYSNREDMKIKDLMLKLQVLKNGVIDERNKNSELEKEITRLKKENKNFEELFTKKENEIIVLSREKYELISKLDIEKQKTENNSSSNQLTNLISGIFQKRDSGANITDSELKKLQNEVHDYQLENNILKSKIEDQSLDFEKCKIEYKNLISLQLEKMKKLENTISEKNKQIEENNKKLEVMFENFKNFDIQKTTFESRILELEKDNLNREEKIVELLLKLEDKDNLLMSYKDNLTRHEIESSEMAKKLAELKNAIIESNMVIQSFKCKKMGALFDSDLEITFGRTDEDEYVMIINDDGEHEYINVEDIEYLKTNDKANDIVDLSYLVKLF